jgi:hypothetical protein
MQNRQEFHQEGEAYGRPSYLDSSTYIVKTKISHFVKLHFARSVSLPNLQSIQQLEAERDHLPFPSLPSLGWPIGITAFFSFGILLVMFGAAPINLLPVYLGLAGLGAYWTYRRLQKRKIASEERARSLERAKDILIEVSRLTDVRAQAASAG